MTAHVVSSKQVHATYHMGHVLSAAACRGFPVERYATNRPGLVVAYWGIGLVLGRIQISQTDRKSDGTVFGSILNHVTVGRFAKGKGNVLTSGTQ